MRNDVKGFIPVNQIGHDKKPYLRYVNYNNITDMGFNGEETILAGYGSLDYDFEFPLPPSIIEKKIWNYILG